MVHLTKLDTLFAKAKELGSLSRDELETVAGSLTSKDELTQSKAIYTLGYVGAVQYADEIYEILASTRKSEVALEALWVLSRHFDQPLRTRTIVLKLLDGTTDDDWEDVLGEVRRRAATIAGDILAVNPTDKELISKLLLIIDDEGERSILRDECYRSLLQIEGRKLDEIENARKIIPSGEFDTQFLDRLRNLISGRLN